MHNVARTTIARLRADFPPDDMRAWLSVFDCTHALPAMGRPQGDAEKRSVLGHFGKLATELGFPKESQEWNLAVLEYRDACGYLLGQPLAAKTNAQAWSSLLPPEFRVPGRIAPLRLLPRIIRLYIAIEDGVCQVERDFRGARSMQRSSGNRAMVSRP